MLEYLFGDWRKAIRFLWWAPLVGTAGLLWAMATKYPYTVTAERLSQIDYAFAILTTFLFYSMVATFSAYVLLLYGYWAVRWLWLKRQAPKSPNSPSQSAPSG